MNTDALNSVAPPVGNAGRCGHCVSGDDVATHARQQFAVATLGQLALTIVGTESVLPSEAVAVVARTLEVEYCALHELLPGGERLVLAAGAGWEEGLVGKVIASAGLGSQAGYTIVAGEPVIAEDLATEMRFVPSALLRDHGVVSSISVVIDGRSGPWGVLGAYSNRPRTFSRNDVHFVQAIANLLANAFERERADREIWRLNEALEQRVVERTAQLEAANKELEAFSYSISHDLRAPLRAVDGFSRMLIEDYAERLDAEGQRFLNVVRSEAQRMARLVDELLRFSRLSRRAMDASQVDMHALVNAAYSEACVDAAGRRIELKISALPPAVGDLSLLRQVWVNLLSNAVKFTREREVAEIEIGAREEENETVYSVRDNGAGFSMEHAGKLFGVFQRLHREDEFEGTGVGLALVQRIIHRHGGRIWAEAQPDHGATFFFTLPNSSL